MCVIQPQSTPSRHLRCLFQGLAALFGVLSLTAMLLTTYYGTDNIPSAPKLCLTGTVFPFSYNLFHMTFVAGAGLMSVAIYICVFIVYRHGARNRITSNNDQSNDIQHRLTVTVGIITFSTLFFDILPFSFLSACALLNVVPPEPQLIGVIFRCSTINNVLIYVYRQEEMQAATVADKIVWTPCVTMFEQAFLLYFNGSAWSFIYHWIEHFKLYQNLFSILQLVTREFFF